MSHPSCERRAELRGSQGTGKEKHGGSRDLYGGLRHGGRRKRTDETSWVSKWRAVSF